jgi:hypothetical protein
VGGFCSIGILASGTCDGAWEAADFLYQSRPTNDMKQHTRNTHRLLFLPVQTTHQEHRGKPMNAMSSIAAPRFVALPRQGVGVSGICTAATAHVNPSGLSYVRGTRDPDSYTDNPTQRPNSWHDTMTKKTNKRRQLIIFRVVRETQFLIY